MVRFFATTTRSFATTFLAVALCSLPAVAQIASPSGAGNSSPAVSTPSALVKPATDLLRTTLPTLHPERWKADKTVRGVTAANVAAIQHDLDATLPGLLTAADVKPGGVVDLLPLNRNLGALYDVLLRVDMVAEPAAPREELTGLARSMQSLEQVRRDLNDRLEQNAAAQDRQVATLQAAVNARPVGATPVTPSPAPAATSHVKKKKSASRTQ